MEKERANNEGQRFMHVEQDGCTLAGSITGPVMIPMLLSTGFNIACSSWASVDLPASVVPVHPPTPPHPRMGPGTELLTFSRHPGWQTLG